MKWLLNRVIGTTLLLIIYLLPALTPTISLLARGIGADQQILRNICGVVSAISLICAIMSVADSLKSIKLHKRMLMTNCSSWKLYLSMDICLVLSCGVAFINIFSPDTLPIYLLGVGIMLGGIILIIGWMENIPRCIICQHVCLMCSADKDLEECFCCGATCCSLHRVATENSLVSLCMACDSTDTSIPR